MKNQYFGDDRDLFKFGLILKIIQSGLINSFVYIPMLTENVPTKNDKHGEGQIRKRDKAGRRNCELKSFLDECEETGKRDIFKLNNFFNDICPINIYGKNMQNFSKDNRNNYYGEGVK